MIMDPTPAPIVEDVINDNIECDEEVKNARLSSCISCDKFQVVEDITKCSECGCNINLLITYTFKTCPIGKW